MVKIKLIKPVDTYKVGEVVNYSKSSAKDIIESGYGKVEEPKTIIPHQLQTPKFRFNLLKEKSKIPFEKEWQKNAYRYDDKKC